MAWVMGYADDSEIVSLSGYEVVELTEEQEISQFEFVDPERLSTEKLIRVWVDCDVTDLLEVE